MLRVKMLQSNKHGRKGDVVVMDNNEAFGLLDSGHAVITKDMVSSDYKLTSDEVQADEPKSKTK